MGHDLTLVKEDRDKLSGSMLAKGALYFRLKFADSFTFLFRLGQLTLGVSAYEGVIVTTRPFFLTQTLSSILNSFGRILSIADLLYKAKSASRLVKITQLWIQATFFACYFLS